MIQPSISETVIRSAQQGDAKAFREIYRAFKNAVYDYCRRTLSNDQEAEDATQEAFVHACERLVTLDDPRAFRSWLYTIVRNEVYGRIRRRKTVRFTSLEDADEVWDPHTPLTRTSSAQMGETIRREIEAMKQEYREVLLLREFDGLSYAEIAAITSDTESSVRSRLFKARRALAGRLAPFFNERNR